ncbi:TPA: hypothetical protein JDY78_13195 [Clostridioides difficile]|nr:hypothetical protein [Clostridioides difficile]
MELKFRQWAKKLQKMYSYDELIHQANNLTEKLICNGVFVPNNKNIETMIYTNINDYNKKEIYEGDIVSYDGNITPFGNDEFIGEVKLVDGCFVIENELLEKCIALFDEIAVIKVIGNIYENFEMLVTIRKNKINVCYQCRNEDISEDARYCKICGIELRVMKLVSVFNFETGEEVYSFLTGKECLIDFVDLREDNPCKLFFENAELRINGVKSFYQDERGIFIKDDEYSYRIIFKNLEW